MANKRISELDFLSNPSLTGVTAFSEGDTTYKVNLQAIKNTIIETGSIQTTGTTLYSANPFAGNNLNITGSIFFGTGSGFNSPLSNNAIFIGNYSGQNNANSNNSTFIGVESGINATGETYDNIYIGYQSGKNTNWDWKSVYVGYQAGSELNSTYTIGQSNIMVGENAAYYADQYTNNTLIGSYAGAYGYDLIYGVGIGHQSAMGTSNVDGNFVGYRAGYYAENIESSNFLGTTAGFTSYYSNFSNFIGYQAGYYAYSSSHDNYIGEESGEYSENSNYNNAFGYRSAYSIKNSEYSNFIGYEAGKNTDTASYSTHIGWRAGMGIYGYPNGLSTGRNNIIIGTNISLEYNRRDSINIGGVLFGTGSYFNITGVTFSGSAGGKLGVNKPNPEHHFDVSGSIASNEFLILSRVSSSLNFVDDTAASVGGVPLGGLYRSGSLIRIRLS